jgi:hypothetical protein
MIRIQAGIETYKDKERLVRLTPLDNKVDLGRNTEDLLCTLFMIADGQDMQPGDGEFDVKLDDKALKKLPWIWQILGTNATKLKESKSNIFIRIQRGN